MSHNFLYWVKQSNDPRMMQYVHLKVDLTYENPKETTDFNDGK